MTIETVLPHTAALNATSGASGATTTDANASALGINTKYSSPPENRGFQAIKKRYSNLSRARSVLTNQARRVAPDKYPNQVYRTIGCRHVMIADYVGIKHNAEFDSTFYTGVQVCGSVWVCPVCAAKIQERRRGEIEKAIQWAHENGYFVQMVTFTFPHYVWQRLDTLLEQQAAAYRRLRSGKVWAKMRKSVEMAGLIRSLEVVIGDNGWHPHTHELWFTKKPVGEYWISEQWEKACVKAGLLDPDNEAQVRAFRLHSVDVREDVDVGDYLAKQDDSRAWGLSDELAKATSKVGRSKGIHPHGLLHRGLEGDIARYIEYVDATKGKRQLYWSKGLKDLVGIDDVTDEELADESREVADVLGLLTADQWQCVIGNDCRAELLEAAHSGGLPAIKEFLRLIGAPPI